MSKRKTTKRKTALKQRGKRWRGGDLHGALERNQGENITRVIEESQLLSPGDRVGVAVSGGADSVALLFLLIELQKKLGIALTVLHFNHKLRGRASDTDQNVVSRLAAKYAIPFHAGSDDIKARAKRDRANLEDTARQARYAFFAEAARDLALNKIAVAHTADDQAETVLAHILRGAGLAGLGGMNPRTGLIVRPLLCTRREELRWYLRSKNQTWREDITNRDVTKMRARIRKKLIPLLQKTFQANVVEHLCALAEHARADNTLLERITEEGFARTKKERSGARSIRIDHLLGDLLGDLPGDPARKSETQSARENVAAIALSRRLVRRIVAEVKPRAGELSAQHVEKILNIARYGKAGNSLSMPGGVEVRRNHDALVFQARAEREAGSRDYEYSIDGIEELTMMAVPELSCRFRFSTIDCPRNRVETSNSGEVLDADALRFPLVLRSWRPGDRFRPARHRTAQKLKRLFNEKRIDRWARQGWPVLISGGSLAWTRGFGASAEFVARDGTQTGIVIAEEKDELERP